MNEKEINLVHQVLLAEVKIRKIQCRQMEIMNRLDQLGITVGYSDDGVFSLWDSDDNYYDLSKCLDLSGPSTNYQKMKISLMQLLRAQIDLEKLLMSARSAGEEIGDSSEPDGCPKQ